MLLNLKMVSKQQKVQKEWKTLEIEVEMPQGVSAEYVENVLCVKGPKGEISKRLKFPRVYIKVENNSIKVGTEKFSQRQKKIIFTYKAHLNNLIKGVTEGFEYSLVVVYAKFPVTVEMKGSIFSVKNLLGEKVPRTVNIPADVKVTISGSNINVAGIDKEKVGQVAASIEQSTRVTNMDRRVVQDGIFITEKPHRKYA